MRYLDKPMVANDMSNFRCVPYRLRRRGAYDLAGRVEESLPAETAVQAGFYLDSLLYFLIKEKLKKDKRTMKLGHSLGKQV